MSGPAPGRTLEALHRAVVEASPDILFVYDVPSRSTVWQNRCVTDLLGYDHGGDQSGDLAERLVCPEDRGAFEAALSGAHDVAGDDPIHVDYRMLSADGTVRWFSRRTAPLTRTEDGQVTQVVGVLRDTTDQQAVAMALVESESLFHQLADSVDVAFLLRSLDPPAFLYVSPRFEQLFGYDPMKVRQTPEESLRQIHPDDLQQFLEKYWKPCQAGLAATLEYRIVSVTGEVRWIRARTSPVTRHTDGLRRAASTVEDVTAARRIEADLKAAREAETEAIASARDSALAAIQTQNDFAASASHELRTPTASVLGFIEEVLENDKLDEEDRHCLEVAYRNAQRLVHLIDDLLVMGEADSHRSETRVGITPVVPLVELVMSSLSAVALRGQVELLLPSHGEEEFGGPPCALADPVRLEQVLTNLVGNAVKYTRPAGQVAVQVTSAADVVLVAVSDTGIGIEPDALQHVFDRFYRASALAGGIKGTGLGLSIARQMVEAQGGALTVTSVLGRGSTFTMTLPAAQPAEASDLGLGSALVEA